MVVYMPHVDECTEAIILYNEARGSCIEKHDGIYSVGITQKETTDFDRNLSFLFGLRARREAASYSFRLENSCGLHFGRTDARLQN